MDQLDKLLKSLGVKLNNIKTKALEFKPMRKPRMPNGYKLKPLPSRPKHGTGMPKGAKIPGVSHQSQKNPVAQARQIKNPGAKVEAMSQAKSLVKYLPNGQWILEKASPIDDKSKHVYHMHGYKVDASGLHESNNGNTTSYSGRLTVHHPDGSTKHFKAYGTDRGDSVKDDAVSHIHDHMEAAGKKPDHDNHLDHVDNITGKDIS